MECSVCGKTFSETNSYDEHLESEEHKKNTLIKQEKQNDSSCSNSENFSSDSKCDKTIKCSTCDLFFNSLESFQNHSETPEHALKVMLKQANSNKIPNLNGSINSYELNARSNAESTSESVLPELNENNSSLSYGSCKVCSKIFSGPEPYKQHLESQAHKKKVALQQNSTFTGGNMILKCEPCNKSFSGQVPYAQHMSSEIHKKKVQNIELMEKYMSSKSPAEANKVSVEDSGKLWLCKICNVQCSGLIPYEQHINGSTHFKNEKRMQNENNFAKMGNGVTPMMLVNNFSENKISEKSVSVPQLMNGDILKDNNSKQNDFVFPEEKNKINVISSEELGELIKIISPDEKIDFDELAKPVIKQNENNKGEELKNTQKDDESSLNDDLEESAKEKKSEVYQTCEFCNMPLLDKDSAIKHFESKEHFAKRWGIKI